MLSQNMPELCETSLYPVVYCGAGGGGTGEFLASTNPNVRDFHEIKVIPGGRVIAAFYQPFHNIRAIDSFASIDVEPHPTAPDTIRLGIASWPGISNRLRIKITVLYLGDRLPATDPVRSWQNVFMEGQVPEVDWIPRLAGS